MKRNVKLVLHDKKVLVAQFEGEEVLGEFTLDEIAELIEFRYATPWNKSKDILEKLYIILEDIKSAYEHSTEVYPKKDTILRKVKIRVQEQ